MKKFASLALSAALACVMLGASAESYTGTVSSNIGSGEVSVTITVEDGKITAAEVAGDTETPGIGLTPIEDGTYANMIVGDDDGVLDNISGATMTTAAVQAALDKAMTEAGMKEAETVQVSDAECDVVIIGAGGAGMTAALQAVDSGANSVILVEKTGATGGNSSRATGGMNAAKTEWQDMNEWSDAKTTAVEATLSSAKEKYGDKVGDLIATVEAQFEAYKANPTGYFDSVELFMLDTMVGGKCLNNLDLVKTLAGNSADAIAWLETKNAVLHNVGSFGGASVNRIHRPVNDEGKTTPVGAYLVKKLTEDVEAEGKIDLRLNTRATELVMDGGKVTGVKVSTENGDYTVTAKAVVLATGGFGYDLDRVAFYCPNLKGFVTTNSAGATGDGLDMATAIGAATVDLDQIQIHPSVYTETAALITEGIRGDGAILVNQGAKRFINELETRDVVSAAELEQEGGYAYIILDQKMMDASATYNGYFTKGYAVQANSYEELAAATGMDAATFTETMNTWNAACTAQVDEAFGRTSFASPLDTAPYYAIKVAPGIHHCMGGIVINTEAQVLDANGNVIEGLLAAGEVTGGVHGANRLGGNAVADIVVFGRIAGQNAAALAQ